MNTKTRTRPELQRAYKDGLQAAIEAVESQKTHADITANVNAMMARLAIELRYLQIQIYTPE